MASELNIRWTEEAVSNLESVLEYLENRWTEKEIKHFKQNLGRLLETISKYPTIFPVSEAIPSMRKAVLRPQTILFYQLEDDCINLISIFQTKQDFSRLAKRMD